LHIGQRMSKHCQIGYFSALINLRMYLDEYDKF
jgi:hypothetical protein